MGKAEVTCKVCGALHDKNYLTPDARIHWAEVAKARGVDEIVVQHSHPTAFIAHGTNGSRLISEWEVANGSFK